MNYQETKPIVPPSSRLIDLTVQAARKAQCLTGNDKSGVGAVLWRVSPQGTYEGVAVASNRFPQGISRHAVRYTNGYFSDFDLHAEESAVAHSARKGKSTEGTTCTTTHCPCFECTTMLIEAGIRHLVIDGAQKLRPKWYQNWLPQGQRTLAMLERAGIDVQVDDLRLNEQGRPDIQMSSEESDGPPFRRYALSTSNRKASVEEGTALYKQAVFAHPTLTERVPDAWLAVPAVTGNNLTGMKLPLQRAAHAALGALARQAKAHPAYPRHAAVIFEEAKPLAEPRVDVSRPPLGCEAYAQDTEGALAWSMVPEMLAVAHAARDGVSLEGKSLYLTHAPTNRGAVVIAGAGIAKVYIDSRSLPKALDEATADRLWKGYVALCEAGVEVNFLHSLKGLDPVQHIHDHLSERVRADIHLTDMQISHDWAKWMTGQRQKEPRAATSRIR